MNGSISYHRAATANELQQILDIQKRNLKANLPDNEKLKEGFVSVSHTFDVLKRMNDKCPHCIAKYGDIVAGYALCMRNEFRNDVPALIPMFNYMDGIIASKGLAERNYIMMGQICIDKVYRKQGIFAGLYRYMAAELKHEFDTIITEVNVKNTRSSQAHKAVGFERLDVHTEEGEDWELIILNI